MSKLYSLGIVGVFAVALLLGCQGCSLSDTGSSVSTAVKQTNTSPNSNEPPAVSVTPEAAAMIAQHKAEMANGSKVYLRLRIVAGGCQGFMHKLDLDPDVSADDYICESAGVRVAFCKRHLEALRGAQVDFVEEDGKRGFKVVNPNVQGDIVKKLLAGQEEGEKGDNK